MSNLMQSVDARTKLAGTNKLEMLLFSLGTDRRTQRKEVYGINVFKVREVMRTPPITRAPEMPDSVEGMVSLRGVLVPVVDLVKYTRINSQSDGGVMIVTEYNGYTQGFLVESVDTILRLDWSSMKVPPEMLKAESGGLVTAVTELPDGRLVMMMDVEKVLAETTGYDNALAFSAIEPMENHDLMVFYADDSHVARKQIQRTLEALQVKQQGAVNGREAWDALQRLANQAEAAQKPLRDMVQLIITDVEMPEMDGYMLTKSIKSDPRFAGIPVVMHSSLSGGSNQSLGKSVGVDGYISKFEPQRLADAVAGYLRKAA